MALQNNSQFSLGGAGQTQKTALISSNGGEPKFMLNGTQVMDQDLPWLRQNKIMDWPLDPLMFPGGKIPDVIDLEDVIPRIKPNLYLKRRAERDSQFADVSQSQTSVTNGGKFDGGNSSDGQSLMGFVDWRGEFYVEPEEREARCREIAEFLAPIYSDISESDILQIVLDYTNPFGDCQKAVKLLDEARVGLATLLKMMGKITARKLDEVQL
jgi:hypothetical protein